MHTHVEIADDRKRKPNTVTDYNRTKCAVDIMDQKARAYTVRAGTRRWPVAVFYNILDLAAMNAHVLYTACTGSTESRRVFMCALAEELCLRFLQKKELKRTPRPSPAPGKKTTCQVQTNCNQNHSITPCAACGKYTCRKCRSGQNVPGCVATVYLKLHEVAHHDTRCHGLPRISCHFMSVSVLVLCLFLVVVAGYFSHGCWNWIPVLL
ncbi:uncharacterized protein LOC143504257 [Brachyhypopomus gauderio]|uniref:uncharacterized protein LOC143504257 n=1 Tax=Brachyhypopomus gauderio TaxID=698409 RepID=UPI0040422CD4